VADRWATFDCYGTLIDWNGGIRAELARVFGEDRAGELLVRYHELEPQIQAEQPSLAYRRVMAEAMRRLGAPPGEEDALGASLPRWKPFLEVPDALAELSRRGWRLAALSNTDPDLLEASERQLGTPFDRKVTASEIGSYKPALRHWEVFFAEADAEPERHVHVAQSHFHDIVPARELGLRTVWVNRLRERLEPPPTREIPDLSTLPGVLDDLVPA
jgi:2-haloacid dehalogenase